MSYVIQASPLTKIFLPEWQEKCIHDPSLALDDKIAFTVHIPRSAGAIVLEHNKPVHVSSLIPVTGRRKVEEDETLALIPWLTGGPEGKLSEETDIYGVVAIDIGDAIQKSIHDMIDLESMLEADEKKRRAAVEARMKAQEETLARIREGVKAAREVADSRVRRALRVTHHNLVKSWDDMKASGKGTFPPSVTEALGAFILAEEIKKHSETRQKMTQVVNDALRIS